MRGGKEKMFGLYTTTEVHYHVRSISLPSRPHLISHKIEAEPKKLKTLDTSSVSVDTASSLQVKTIKAGVRGLAELHNCIQELIDSPVTQQALLHRGHKEEHEVEKALDMSVGFLDVCGSARELLLMMKEHVQDLLSTLRRKGLDSSIKNQISAYICLRKKARRDISKNLKALETMESSIKSYPLSTDHHLLMVVRVLRELSIITISFFRKLLLFMCAPTLKKNTHGWSLISRIVSTGSDREKRIINEMGGIDIALWSFHRRIRKAEAKDDLQIVKRGLEELDGSIRELEVGLDCLFRCLIQHRVSLLNLLTH